MEKVKELKSTIVHALTPHVNPEVGASKVREAGFRGSGVG